MTALFIVQWIFAFSPIFTVLVLMIFKNWSGSRAGAAGWFVALIAATLVFGAHPKLLAYSQMKGVLLSLNVLYIIWAALLLYNIVNETGAIKAISIGIERFSGDKSIQILIFGWLFASFLQGVAGYGVPIAVVAPLLFSLGFSPVVAVAVPAIRHSWSVTFGSMGGRYFYLPRFLVFWFITQKGFISRVFGSFYPLIKLGQNLITRGNWGDAKSRDPERFFLQKTKCSHCMIHLNQIPGDTPSGHVHAAVAACHTYGRFPMPEDLDDVQFEIPEREPFLEFVKNRKNPSAAKQNMF